MFAKTVYITLTTYFMLSRRYPINCVFVFLVGQKLFHDKWFTQAHMPISPVLYNVCMKINKPVTSKGNLIVYTTARVIQLLYVPLKFDTVVRLRKVRYS